MLISHVDMRVSNRERAERFYGELLGMLDAMPRRNTLFTTFALHDELHRHWFGITEDPAMTPSRTRIAFDASSREVVDRVAEQLSILGATQIEPPGDNHGYYAVFFADPDGNLLEVAYWPE